MVTDNHFRWDFIGLSTDQKPTPATSPKVVDGSTFYCSDNSKLYVWCKTQWYEKTVSGGGGGTTYTAGDGITIADSTISVDTTTIQPKLTAGSGIDITANEISADTTVLQPKLTAGSNITISDENVISTSASGGTIKTLTTADYNYPTENPNGVAAWLLEPGWYNKTDPTVGIYYNANTRDTVNKLTFNIGYEISDLSGQNSYKPIYFYFNGSAQIHFDLLHTTDGAQSLVNNVFLNGKGINNNLTTTQSGYVLDARQGKALNDKITPDTGSGAPTTATSGAVGKIYIDTTNNTAYMCVSDTGGTYTWKAITA